MDPSIEKYSEQLHKLGIRHEMKEHPELKTPAEVQGYLGLSLADGLSTMIMKAGESFVAVIRRDDCRIDFKALKKSVHKNIRMASPDEYSSVTGMPLGAARILNPRLRTYLDRKLFEKEYLTGGTGSFTCSFRYRAKDLKKLPESEIVDIASEGAST